MIEVDLWFIFDIKYAVAHKVKCTFDISNTDHELFEPGMPLRKLMDKFLTTIKTEHHHTIMFHWSINTNPIEISGTTGNTRCATVTELKLNPILVNSLTEMQEEIELLLDDYECEYDKELLYSIFNQLSLLNYT